MARKKYQVSVHGRDRIRQRTEYSRSKDIDKLFQKAVRDGKSPSEFKPPFSNFLKSKLQEGKKIKVYQNLIFIYKNHKLITSYKVPERYLRQLALERQQDAIKRTFSGMKNKKLREDFLQCLDMYVSLAQLGHSIIIYQDEETVEKMVEMWLKIKTILLEFKIRIGVDEFTPEVVIDDANIIDYSKACYIEFISLTTNFVGFGANKNDKTKGQRNQDKRDFTRLITEIDRCVDFIHEKNYYLVQSQGME